MLNYVQGIQGIQGDKRHSTATHNEREMHFPILRWNFVNRKRDLNKTCSKSTNKHAPLSIVKWNAIEDRTQMNNLNCIRFPFGLSRSHFSIFIFHFDHRRYNLSLPRSITAIDGCHILVLCYLLTFESSKRGTINERWMSRRQKLFNVSHCDFLLALAPPWRCQCEPVQSEHIALK